MTLAQDYQLTVSRRPTGIDVEIAGGAGKTGAAGWAFVLADAIGRDTGASTTVNTFPDERVAILSFNGRDPETIQKIVDIVAQLDRLRT